MGQPCPTPGWAGFSLEEKLSYWKGLSDFEQMRLIVAGLYCDFLPEGNPWDPDDDCACRYTFVEGHTVNPLCCDCGGSFDPSDVHYEDGSLDFDDNDSHVHRDDSEVDSSETAADGNFICSHCRAKIGHDFKCDCVGDVEKMSDVSDVNLSLDGGKQSDSETFHDNVNDARDDVNHGWGSDSEEEIHSESVNMTAPRTPNFKKRRSPASKRSQMSRLLQHQEKLVLAKGLPKSNLQTKLDLTPAQDVLQLDKSPICRKNLFSNFPTSPSKRPVRLNWEKTLQSNVVSVESESARVKCNADNLRVVSSSHENSSLLSHSREESNKNDISPPHIPSVPSPDNQSSDQVHVPAFPESSAQSTAHPRDRKVHVPPVHCKDEKIFGTSSGKKDNSYFPNKSLYAEPFVSEQENFDTGAQPSVLQGGIYLPSGWYINAGAAYCGGCQLHGILLQRLN